MESDDHGVDIFIHLQMAWKDELAAYTMKSDGSNGHCIAFAAKEYGAGDNDLWLDVAVVYLVDVFLTDR